MIQGTYRDQVFNRQGRLLIDWGWSPNTIVDSAWPLVAGLLKNDPVLDGIIYLAIGTGDPAWDGTGMVASHTATGLHNEIGRQVLSEEDMAYLNPDGSPASAPTSTLEVTATFSWPGEDQTLREFGLFGGDATEDMDSGMLINYVIHPSLTLESGSTLRRRLRLTLRPKSQRDWLEVPQHWLRTSPVVELDGVGTTNVVVLEAAGINTIGDLADADPAAIGGRLSYMKLVELRAKARLGLRTAGGMTVIPELAERNVLELLCTSVPELAAATGIARESLQVLHEQLSVLQLALDNRFLMQVTLMELVFGA